MKIIVLGDIHGNLPALEACYEKAEEEGYDWMVHTGDVVGYGPFPAECVDFLHQRNIPGARGNFDENIGYGAEESGASDTDPEERTLAEESFRWTSRTLGLWTKRWLADLPFGVHRQAGRRHLAIFHASPLDLSSCLLEDMPEPAWVSYGKAAEADIIVLGHIHRSFHRTIDGRDFINAGSVGRPRDRNPQTGYAVIETDGDVRVDFRRFAYDVERTVQAVMERGLPEVLAERLRQGA
jgi:predicted phosphodiesterase